MLCALFFLTMQDFSEHILYSSAAAPSPDTLLLFWSLSEIILTKESVLPEEVLSHWGKVHYHGKPWFTTGKTYFTDELQVKAYWWLMGKIILIFILSPVHISAVHKQSFSFLPSSLQTWRTALVCLQDPQLETKSTLCGKHNKRMNHSSKSAGFIILQNPHTKNNNNNTGNTLHNCILIV